MEVDPNSTADIGLPPGMKVRMQGRAGGGESLRDALASNRAEGVYAGAIYEIVERLLRPGARELWPEVLRKLRSVVPAARRTAVVAWPPDADGTFRHLMPVQGDQPGREVAISRTLAQHVIQTGSAFWLQDASTEDEVSTNSVIMKGIHSAVYVPLISSSQQVVGLLCVDSPTPTLPLSAQHFKFICAVGGLLTSSLVAEELREEARRQQLEAQEIQAHRAALVSFLQIASHDLKNPLMAISNGAQMVERVPPARRSEILRIIFSASRRANDLIAAYLAVSEVESGRPLRVDWGSVDPRDLMDEEIDFLRLALRDRLAGITLVNRIDCGIVRADVQKLRQILSNLVSNAIKYSPAGGDVVIESERREHDICLHIRDQGVGISPEDQSRLFAAFERVGNRALAPGSGLGLWLTAALVEAQGGRIWLSSQPGAGSTFSVSLPQSPGLETG